MANPKHLQVLLQGVEAWNKWRELNEEEFEGPGFRKEMDEGVYIYFPFDREVTTQWKKLYREIRDRYYKSNPSSDDQFSKFKEYLLSLPEVSNTVVSNLYPDLSDADLRGVDLAGFNLESVDLSGASLAGAILNKTCLSSAILRKANLRNVDFRGMRARWVDLRDTDLTGLDLSGLDLSGAVLNNSILDNARFVSSNLMYVKAHETSCVNADLTSTRLNEAEFINANLSGAIFEKANLNDFRADNANLTGAKLKNVISVERANSGARPDEIIGSYFHQADLTGADLSNGDFKFAWFTQTVLTNAVLYGGNFYGANFTDANLCGANLKYSNLVNANLERANISNCLIHGVSAWNTKLEGAIQHGLVITARDEPVITVDNLEVAQFIHLLLNNQNVRDVVNTLTSKTILILGRFTPKRKSILDALRDELRNYNYVTILFDFEVPDRRDVTETVTLLARMSRFIIADLTEPSSIPKELEAIVPTLAIPVQPLLEGSASPYSMFRDYWKYDWVLDAYRYDGKESLITSLMEKVVTPAETKLEELERRKNSS